MPLGPIPAADASLIRQASALAVPRRLGLTAETASVGAAVVAADGTVFTGVCLDAACGVGFCAEHAAIGAMISAGQSRILTMVAAKSGNIVLPPCGRCRELALQIDPENHSTRILLPGGHVLTLGALVPHWWQENRTLP